MERNTPLYIIFIACFHLEVQGELYKGSEEPSRGTWRSTARADQQWEHVCFGSVKTSLPLGKGFQHYLC